jgi:F-type H+-transporting ATPase subunit c
MASACGRHGGRHELPSAADVGKAMPGIVSRLVAITSARASARINPKGAVPLEMLVPDVLATLTSLGKALGFGLAIGLAAFGTAIGVGIIFASMIQSAARQPEAKADLQPIMWLGFAMTEAVVFYGLIGAILLVFLV